MMQMMADFSSETHDILKCWRKGQYRFNIHGKYSLKIKVKHMSDKKLVSKIC